ncbi:hypothetical protein PMZ80_009451 [Knufia obscura]|uniref:Uncharacterized protein n=1 Tax=Knufia obscura TaxID=1635080 RepID=A0ABR0RE14_9EURO|nr:hypothetical protein PMZ80_009451 [Knufia obscura]
MRAAAVSQKKPPPIISRHELSSVYEVTAYSGVKLALPASRRPTNKPAGPRNSKHKLRTYAAPSPKELCYFKAPQKGKPKSNYTAQNDTAQNNESTISIIGQVVQYYYTKRVH